MKLRELLDPTELSGMIEGGFIRVREHPSLPLRIYNYTEQTAYSNTWNDSTRACRGLIVDAEDNVIARPFGKFMNFGQPGADEIEMDEPVQVTDKMDGSLGILYPTPEGYAIATRGSFSSDQAIHATKLLNSIYNNFEPVKGYTYLFEIVYPDNRIVLDYGDTDDLIILAAIEIESGDIFGPNDMHWPGPRAQQFEYDTLTKALAAEPRKNAEGLVVRTHDGRMVKIKQEDYVALHKIVTGLNERVVWEAMSNYRLNALMEQVPDEFYKWINKVAGELFIAFSHIERCARDRFDWICGEINAPHEIDRREFAGLASKEDSSIKPLLFKLLDGQDMSALIWKQLRPVGSAPVQSGEDIVQVKELIKELEKYDSEAILVTTRTEDDEYGQSWETQEALEGVHVGVNNEVVLDF